MKKEIAITKNGFDLLRIIEGKNDKYECEFIIEPMIDVEKTRIFAMPLFSEPQYIPFDKNCKLHITYHKSTLTKPTKIHLCMEFENGQSKYETLPLNNLIDPNINTEIPIPLLKVVIPDDVLTVKYNKKTRHKEFDIKDSNIIEVFMTKADFGIGKFHEKWENMSHALMENSFQYMATGLSKYIGINLFEQLHTSRTKEHISAVFTDVTDNIGIFMNTIESIELNVKTMDFLFIDNAAYLAFVGGLEHYNQYYPKGKLTYELDVDNENFFDYRERRKWNYRFNREFEKVQVLIKRSNGKYAQQIRKEEKEAQELVQIESKVAEFKKKLIKVYYNKSIERKMLSNSASINLLLAKYLGIKEPKAFVTRFCVENHEDTFEFDEFLLEYNNHYVEILYGELKALCDGLEYEPDILIKGKIIKKELKTRGYCRKLLSNENIKIVSQNLCYYPKEQMEQIFNDKENETCRLYELIMKND